MSLLNVRRLVAVDMYGTTGSARRRRLIRAEFVIGAAGCTLLGVLLLMSASGWDSHWEGGWWPQV
jgi:hypothetical protein